MYDTSYPYQKVIDDYPHLYSHLHEIECGAGWFHLIDILSAKLEKIILNIVPDNDDPKYWSSPHADQVKEKYGTLRFYMSWETDEMPPLIDQAETDSASICESCGEEGEILRTSWLACLCDKCRRERAKRR